jgi:hypothetical protein
MNFFNAHTFFQRFGDSEDALRRWVGDDIFQVLEKLILRFLEFYFMSILITGNYP